MTPREKALEIVKNNPGIGRGTLRERLGIGSNACCKMLNNMRAAGQIVITGTKFKQHLFLAGVPTVIPPILPEYTEISDAPIKALWQGCRHHPELKDYLGTDNPLNQYGENRANGAAWIN